MSTGYASGMRKHRIEILNRTEAVAGAYGIDSAGVEWESSGCVWAAVDWAKGMRSMNAGAIDAYGIVLVRMNWLPAAVIGMRSRIKYEGQIYQILPETFHSDRQQNIIQFTAQVIINEL